MKFLLLFLLVGCGSFKERCTNCSNTYNQKLQSCMEEFADKGYTADALVKICGKVHEKRD